MGKSIGIDLGTTNSVAGIKKVETEILKNNEGNSITPSCVTVGKKGLLGMGKAPFIVGKDAYEWRKQDPTNCITGVKRLIGRGFNDEEIQNLINEKKQSYTICEHSNGHNSIAVELSKKEYTPQEISAEILKKIKTDSEKSLGDEVDSAVITVPAYFNDKQKHATRAAANLAGLKVRRLLPEPTAAAISFGVDEVNEDQALNIIVFDFGGGTFDLSLLTISGGQFIEQGKGGDMWLGGNDIDTLLTDFVIKSFEEEEDINYQELLESQKLKEKNRFLGELQAGVEEAKIALTTDDEAVIEISGILKDKAGDTLDLDVEITREQFDELIADIANKTVTLTKQLIKEIDFTDDLIDKILLVGGSSKIPAIGNALKAEFGDEKVMLHKNPMLAIAEGAAILSHRLADTYECPKCGEEVNQADKECKGCQKDLEASTISGGVLDIVHTTAHDYYIELEGGEIHSFIEKNTPLPCEASETFQLLDINQKLVHLKFSNSVNNRSENIGELWLGFDVDLDDYFSREEIDTMMEKNVGLSIKVDMKIDENNLISVDASINGVSGANISKTLSRGGADEKIFFEMEKFITEVNDEESSLDTFSITRRLVEISNVANNIVNEADETNEVVLSNLQARLNKTKKKFENNICEIDGNVGYLKNILKTYGDYLDPKERKEAAEMIALYNDSIKNDEYDKHIKVLDDVKEFVLGSFEDLRELATLQQAIGLLGNYEKNKELNIKKELDNMNKTYEKLRLIYSENKSEYQNELDKCKTVLYQAASLVRMANNEKAGSITKGIQR